jgi:hypothetical protein
MTLNASIETIKAALIDAYESITLPGALGMPTGISGELDGNPPTLPYVEVFENPTLAIRQPRDEYSYEVTRRFIVRLYIARLDRDTPSVSASNRQLANNCIEPIEDHFMFTDDRLGVDGVLSSTINADTSAIGGTPLFTRANDNYVGVAFDHTVIYYRQR